MHVLIIDPALLELSGHHFNYNKAIAEELRRRGMDVDILAHRRCDEAICDVLGAQRCFDVDTYALQEVASRDMMLRKLAGMSEVTLANLRDSPVPGLTGDTMILVHTATVFQIPALYAWYAGLPAPRPRILIQFMHPPWYLGHEEEPGFCTAVLETALEPWSTLHGARVRFASDNPFLVDFLAGLTNGSVATLPMPMAYPPVPKGTCEDGAGVLLGFLGDGRDEKGFPVLAESLLQNAELIPANLRFLIHVSNTAGVDAAQALRSLPECNVVMGQFTAEDYWAALAACDVILLPYDPEKYRWRGSGIFMEALGMGKPVVTTAGSCLDRLLDIEGGAGVRGEFTPESLWDAILRAADEFPALKAQAIAAAPRVRARHNPASFVNAVLAALPA